ncbi:MAG: hypothetical protein ACKVHP_21265, partial [Verrucomicrobiales bacterium]
PDSSPQYTQEEILAEMDDVFVERDILSFSMHTDSVPVLLRRMTESVGLGFGERQAETLAHRVAHQKLNDFYQATYPVELGGIASDLEFQWCREDEWTVRMAICAVEEVLQFAADSVADLAIEHQA